MSSGLFSTSHVLIGAGTLITAGIVGGVLLSNSQRTPAPNEKAAVAEAAEAAFARTDEAAKTGANSLCPEDMVGIAASQGGVDVCGTGRPPALSTALPLNGIWEVESPGNPKVAALTVFVNHQYGILHRTDPNAPSTAHGVWQLKGEAGYGQNHFSVTLSITEDGAVTTGLGQFEFCMCVQIKWSVKPTADPNLMVGEWSYRGQRGTSIWRRRSAQAVIRSVAIGNAYTNESGEWTWDQFEYGSRPGRIERRHPVSCGHGRMRGNCDALWITVLGENFAGNHNIWIDPATHIELNRGHWVCGSGATGYTWDRCGVGADPGATVAGVQFKLIFWDGMVPGPINVWVDGHPIPIEMVIHGYPEPPRLRDRVHAAQNLVAEADPSSPSDVRGRTHQIIGHLWPYEPSVEEIAQANAVFRLLLKRERSLEDSELETVIDKILSGLDEATTQEAWLDLLVEVLDRTANFTTLFASSEYSAEDAERLSNIVKYASQALDDVDNPSGALTGENASKITKFLNGVHAVTALASVSEDPDAEVIMDGIRDALSVVPHMDTNPITGVVDVPGEVVASMLNVTRTGFEQSASALDEIAAAIEGDPGAIERAIARSREVEATLSGATYGEAMYNAITNRIIDKVPFARAVVTWFTQ